jgi:hypothetical protein
MRFSAHNLSSFWQRIPCDPGSLYSNYFRRRHLSLRRCSPLTRFLRQTSGARSVSPFIRTVLTGHGGVLTRPTWRGSTLPPVDSAPTFSACHSASSSPGGALSHGWRKISANPPLRHFGERSDRSGPWARLQTGQPRVEQPTNHHDPVGKL